jgi:hypothetical protein
MAFHTLAILLLPVRGLSENSLDVVEDIGFIFQQVLSSPDADKSVQSQCK